MSEAIDSTMPCARRRPDDVAWRALTRRLLRGTGLELHEPARRPSTGSRPATKGAATLSIRDPATYREVLTKGSVGLGRSYAAGWWEADDLVWVLRLLTRRLNRSSRRRRFTPFPSRVIGMGRRRPEQGQDRDRRDIQAHYDLGDEFFAQFLDPTLTYSCAYFEKPGMTLEQASVAKLERICSLAEITWNDDVMEIGTGWGSFALHAARRYGCSVTTTTVSPHQLAYARRKVAERGLQAAVSVLDLDYRDLRGRFDKVVSIEMVEAVGWRQLDAFFEVCARLLRPGGLLVVQAIVIADQFYERSRRRTDFIKSEIFPGSSIPSFESIAASARRTGALRLVECHDIGLHYAETLSRWREKFRERSAEIAALGFDESFRRRWEFYLAYCEAGFAERRISDMQLVFEAPGGTRHRGSPVT